MIKSTKLVQSSTFLKKSHRILAKKEIHMVHSRTGSEHVPYIESSPMWTADLIPGIQFGCCLHEGYLCCRSFWFYRQFDLILNLEPSLLVLH